MTTDEMRQTLDTVNQLITASIRAAGVAAARPCLDRRSCTCPTCRSTATGVL